MRAIKSILLVLTNFTIYTGQTRYVLRRYLFFFSNIIYGISPDEAKVSKVSRFLFIRRIVLKFLPAIFGKYWFLLTDNSNNNMSWPSESKLPLIPLKSINCFT